MQRKKANRKIPFALIAQNGTIWSSGVPLTKFDPKSGLFTRVEKMPDTYDLAFDIHGNAWFTDPDSNKIGRVDKKHSVSRNGSCRRPTRAREDCRPLQMA